MGGFSGSTLTTVHQMPTLVVENVLHTKVVPMIDVSRLQRRKVDMTPPADLRTEDEKVLANVKGELAERFPWDNGDRWHGENWKDGVCIAAMKRPDWNEKSFLAKCQSLYIETASYYM